MLKSTATWHHVLICLGLLLLPQRESEARFQTYPDRLALVGATVITVRGDEIIPNATVLIDDGVIAFVGPAKEAPDTDRYRVLDVSGSWLTPGIIDTNVHLILTTVPEFFVKYEDRLEEIAIQSSQVGLKYGMTTMADSWGPLEPLLSARDRINSGEVVGADVLIAGNIVGLGGPFSDYFMGSWGGDGSTLRNGDWVHPAIKNRIDTLWEAGVGPSMLAMTPTEVADHLRSYIARGVDFVKVAVSGHGIEPVEPLMFSPAALSAMREVAREAGIPFQTHTATIESLRMAIDVEPDLLQHPNVITPSRQSMSEDEKVAVTALMKRISRMNIFSGLMAIPERLKIETYRIWTSGEAGSDPYVDRVMDYRKKWFENTTYDEMAAGIRAWLSSGVPYTLATDQGPEAAELGPTIWGRLGRAHFDRMIGLQDAGAEPIEILTASTLNGAAAYGLERSRGSIEVGKIADLLVLSANPLADITNMRTIRYVIKNGRVVDRDRLPTVKVLDYDPEATWPR
jgi:imidazolonepropionase-like amidohydrolase